MPVEIMIVFTGAVSRKPFKFLRGNVLHVVEDHFPKGVVRVSVLLPVLEQPPE